MSTKCVRLSPAGAFCAGDTRQDVMARQLPRVRYKPRHWYSETWLNKNPEKGDNREINPRSVQQLQKLMHCNADENQEHHLIKHTI